jgi:hypothetical protein
MVDCSGFIQPLNLECLFVNTLAGSRLIFIGIAMLAMFVLAGKFRMSNIVVALMFGLFFILITFTMEGWIMIMLLIVGFGLAYWFSKTVKQ